jgi:DamX protein
MSEEKKQKSNYQGMGIAVLAAIAVIYLVVATPEAPVTSTKISLDLPTPHTAKSIEPILLSEVPPYFVEANRQDVLPTQLRRVELDRPSDNDDEALIDSEPVLDKVVVAPKVVHVTTTPAPKKSSVKSKPAVHAQIVKKASLKTAHSALPGRYTIQLLASHNKATLQNFIVKNALTSKAKIRQMNKEGQLWYILTLGEFPQREHAGQAVLHLPKGIGQLKPWIRALSDFKTG